MIKRIITVSTILFFLSSNLLATGYDVFGIGLYDVKIDGSGTQQAADLRYERRFDKSIIEIGPESENFFYLKPFLGFEGTSDSAKYILGGIYLEDNLGSLFVGKKSNYNFTPSFGAGYYAAGSGKKLGHHVGFRTSLEISYELKNFNRIGFSFNHISNANFGNKNPGVEVISFSYQIPFD